MRPFLRPLLLALTALVLPVPIAEAQQPVSVHGRIEKLAAPIGCAPTATHIVKDTAVLLKSSTLNLDLFLNTNKRIIGTNQTVTCPIIEVTAVENGAFSLAVCNQPALGCAVTLDMCPSPTQGQYLLFVSPGVGFAPVSVATGSFLLSPLFLTIGTGANTAVCQSVPLFLSGPSTLVGLELWFQAASIPTAGPPILSSSTKTTILGGGGCTNFACY